MAASSSRTQPTRAFPTVTQQPTYIPRTGHWVAKARFADDVFRIVFAELRPTPLKPEVTWFAGVLRYRVVGRAVTMENWGVVSDGPKDGGSYLDREHALLDALRLIRDRLGA